MKGIKRKKEKRRKRGIGGCQKRKRKGRGKGDEGALRTERRHLEDGSKKENGGDEQ